MKRRYGVWLAACVWLASALPAHAIVLRYRPKVGVETKYRVSLAGRTETTMGNLMPEPLRVEMSGYLDYTEKALSETAETVRVETRLAGGKMTVTMEEQGESLDMPVGRMVADVDRRGRLVKLIENDLGDLEGTQGMMAGGPDAWSDLSILATFPEGDVKAGDVWSDEMALPAISGGPEIRIKSTSRLLALTEFQERHCAKIRTTFEGPVTLDLGQMGAPGGSMEGTLRGEIVWYYDHGSSLYVQGEGSVAMDLGITMGDAEGAVSGMSSKMLMNLKMALVK